MKKLISSGLMGLWVSVCAAQSIVSIQPNPNPDPSFTNDEVQVCVTVCNTLTNHAYELLTVTNISDIQWTNVYDFDGRLTNIVIQVAKEGQTRFFKAYDIGDLGCSDCHHGQGWSNPFGIDHSQDIKESESLSRSSESESEDPPMPYSPFVWRDDAWVFDPSLMQ